MNELTTELEQIDNASLITQESRDFELVQRKARLFSSSDLVPADYQYDRQGNKAVANCVIAMNLARQINMDPLTVMQNLFVIHGRPAWSTQFLIAAFNACGRFTPLVYRWTGTEGTEDWGCYCESTIRETDETVSGTTVTILMAIGEGWMEKRGSKWKTMPEHMLRFRAAAFFIRQYAPELTFGLYTQDEVRDIAT